MQQNPDNRAKALTFTVLLHIILVAVIVLGIEFSDYRPLSGPKIDIIEAEIVPVAPSKSRVDPEIERRKQEEEQAQRQREEQARARELESERAKAESIARQKAEAEEKQKAEKEDLRKAEQERKLTQEKAEQEAKKKEAEAKAIAEAKRKAELEEKNKAELAAKKKAEEELKRKQMEEETRRKAEAEQRRRESEMQEMLAQEQRERELNPQRNAYIAAISSKIAGNWLKPPGISSDLKCVVLVNQLPDGSVTGARITKSSGNATFDDSVLKAVYKAAPLPLAPTPEVFSRDLEVAFCSTGNQC